VVETTQRQVEYGGATIVLVLAERWPMISTLEWEAKMRSLTDRDR
jgi:hypothetical protein